MRSNLEYSWCLPAHTTGRGARMAVSPRIFVSYRREDASGHSGRLYDSLKAKFPGLVFRDVDSLEPGDDFAVRIEEFSARPRC